MTGSVPYNPLAKENLGRSIGEALLRQECGALAKMKPFRGAGVYALYYTGKFKPYGQLAARNRGGKFELPVYVGKAIPKGGRKGTGDAELDGNGKAIGSEDAGSVGSPLFARLRKHAQSIQEANNLDIADFWFRALVVDDIFIPLGERLLIARFSPLWNTTVDGFGLNDPGKGRHAGEQSRWDALHPGRSWAHRLVPRRQSVDVIVREIKAHLERS